MEADDAVSSRPESPKKKVKSNPPSDSEAQASESSSTSKHGNDPDYYSEMNGVAPTRKFKYSSVPDSSSESTSGRILEVVSTRVQEEEVSSSENCISQTQRKRSEVSASVDADSISNEPEDLTVCDSASSDFIERL